MLKTTLLASTAAVVLALPGAALAQTSGSDATNPPGTTAQQDDTAKGEIIVTATRRNERLQDVPLAITAFTQAELSEKGVVGYEGLAQNTPGVVVNKPTANFNNFSSRGIATNGYNANLQSTVAIYLDEVPISANGNSTVIDPNLFDVERVEFLRGPQGTLFGSGSLAGALRIISKNPDLTKFDYAGLVDLGLTNSDSIRQRYNAMVNVPLAQDKLGLRVVGFYRHEDGYLDNVGTGVHNSNTLKDWGGRAILLFKPTDNLSIRLMGIHEDSYPEDSALTSPSLGRNKRRSSEADIFSGVLDVFNGTLDYDFGGARLTSSTNIGRFDQKFFVDLNATFGFTVPFRLDASAYDDIFVQETRIASTGTHKLDWVVGGFYYYKRRDVDYVYRSTLPYLTARNMLVSGLIGDAYQRFGVYGVSRELAGFGELTYHFNDKFWVTGGLRYGRTEAQGFNEAGGYNSNYLARALGGLTGPLTLSPVTASVGVKASGSKPSYKISASFKPSPYVTTYATLSTGFRAPIVNARAGAASVVNPSDIIIPNGADSDSIKNYEVGLKGRFFDGKLTANLAAYLIDWRNIQVQANRVSDSVQFATNIGAARSKGIEFEIGAAPFAGFNLGFVGSLNDSKVTELSTAEAAISGAVKGMQLAFPHFQATTTARYSFPVNELDKAYISAAWTHVSRFPGLFPNQPGKPGVPQPTFGYTDNWDAVNLQAGTSHGKWTYAVYIENLLDNHETTYVHPESFFASRFGTLRPRTGGIRIGYNL